MGYTHNWYRPQTIAPATFQAITADFQRVLPALEAAGSPIANQEGVAEPEFTAECIHFNGVRFCGHPANLEVRLPWPVDGATGFGCVRGSSHLCYVDILGRAVRGSSHGGITG